MTKVDIGIIGAMPAEVEAIIASLDGAAVTAVSGIDFYTGKLFGKKVAVAKCGIGKVFAAICAEAMILNFKPDLIVNTGVGGALEPSLSPLDIVIADKLVQHDMDTSALGDPKGLVSGINKIYFDTDARAVEILLSAAAEIGANASVGTIATGDRFISSLPDKERIRADFSASACEMEGGAIAHTAYINSVPFAVVRAISDSADGKAEMDYPEFLRGAAQISTKLTLELVKNY